MSRTLPLMRFRFAEGDRDRYGDDWWLFDEAQLSGLRARELMALDDELHAELRLNVQTALVSFARGEARGSLAVMWLARRLAGHVEPLDGFDPLPMLAEVELLRDEPDGDDADPPAGPSSSSPVSEEA